MVTHARLATIAVAALVALAGCSGVLDPGGESAATPGETVTPAPTPDRDVAPAVQTPGSADDGGDVPAAAYPPGIDADGIANRSALWDAHRAALNGSSYTLRVVRTTDSVALGPARRTIRVANESRFLITGGPDDAGLAYVDATGYYFRELELREGRVTDVGRVVAAEHDRDPPRLAGFDALATADGTVTRLERDGQVFYRVHVTQLGEWMPTNVDNYSMTAYVRPDGLVRTVALAYDVHGWGGQRRQFERYDYLRVGNTTVPEPDWVTRARQRSTGTPVATPTPGTATTTPDPSAATATD